jgi:hypothetical protein
MPEMPDDALLAAYRETAYLAFPPEGGSIEVRLDRLNPDLDALLLSRGARSGTFVTAWNPWSRPAGAAENRAAAARLAAEVAAAGLEALPHRGRGDAGDWPEEEGLLVLGLDRAGALELGRRHRQNAVVHCEAGRPPELLLAGPGEPGTIPAEGG